MRGLKTNQWMFVLLLACSLAFLPIWPYSADWDYSLSGRTAVVLVVFVILKITQLI